jgi:HD-GYP domain-containing protein (c-di-GMP phosphodiesterase class II)
MTRREAAPLSIVVLGVALLALALLVLVASVSQYPFELPPQISLLIVAILLSENFALELSPFSSVSMSLPLTMAAVLFGGPGIGGLAAVASCANYRDLVARRSPAVTAFNLAQIVLSACLGGALYASLGGRFMSADGFSGPLTGGPLRMSLLAWVVAGGFSTILNLVLVGIGTVLMRNAPTAEVVRSALSILPSQFALALIGFLIAQVVAISPLALPLFLVPLLLARQIYQRYARLRDEYLGTIRSLVSALEAKDPYTRGHSERVAQYACMLGERCGLDSRSIDNLRQAALLHDVGKLTLSARLLTKPGALSDSEYALVRGHPAAGALMVSRIPALRGLSELVRCHHERIDGGGYPAGLSGEQIPRMSRVLAIADAYDAMTSARAYRGALSHDQAVMQLIAGRGAQFDEAMVREFVAADVRVRLPVDGTEALGQTASECAG